MKRVAFKMKLKPGCAEEYRKRHDTIWPELKALIRDSGIQQYSIFLDDETDTLFAVQWVTGDHGSQTLGGSEVVKRWWAYMADLMITQPDNSPASIELPEVFYLE